MIDRKWETKNGTLEMQKCSARIRRKLREEGEAGGLK